MDETTPDLNRDDYAALRDGTAVLVRLEADPLVVGGDDRSDFLQRMTTNDVNALQIGKSTVTVLTTPTAHIQFVFTVLSQDDELILLPAPGESEALAKHLRGQIFFMDKVEVRALARGRWRVLGPNAEDTLRELGLLQNDVHEGDWRQADDLLVLRQDRYDIPGFEIVSPMEVQDEALSDLVRIGAVLLTDDEAYTTRRVELGIPAPGHELTDDYNPLEVGLGWACSDKKGCYTGQEIIARQITYDKVTRSLVGLVCEDVVSGGDSVVADVRSVGQITSAAYSPALNRQIALAVLRRPHTAPGVRVTVKVPSGKEVAAEVVELPFE